MGIKVVALAKREKKKHNLSVDRSDCVLELKSPQRFVCACVFEFLCAVNGHLVWLTVCFLRKKKQQPKKQNTNTITLKPSSSVYTVYFYSKI